MKGITSFYHLQEMSLILALPLEFLCARCREVRLSEHGRDEMGSRTPSYLTGETLGEMTFKPEATEEARLSQVFWIDLVVSLLRTKEHT